MQTATDTLIQRIERLNRLFSYPIPAWEIDLAQAQHIILAGTPLLIAPEIQS